MGIGSLGISELVVIFIIVLVFFGPKRMPEVARSLGSAMREFRRSLNQIQRELEEADPTRELRKETQDILSRLPEEVRPKGYPGGARPAGAETGSGTAFKSDAGPKPVLESESRSGPARDPEADSDPSPEQGPDGGSAPDPGAGSKSSGSGSD